MASTINDCHGGTRRLPRGVHLLAFTAAGGPDILSFSLDSGAADQDVAHRGTASLVH